jgi:hypothetical protein
MIIAEATEKEENFTLTVPEKCITENELEIFEGERRIHCSVPTSYIPEEKKGRIIVAEDQMINI